MKKIQITSRGVDSHCIDCVDIAECSSDRCRQTRVAWENKLFCRFMRQYLESGTSKVTIND